jgi:hypothetical protein
MIVAPLKRKLAQRKAETKPAPPAPPAAEGRRP